MTSFIYPTWADIIGQNFKHFENWADSAGGNEFIFNSIVECNQRNKFSPGDTVVVMWTTTPRHDYYRYNEWKHATGLYLDRSNEHLHVSCGDGYDVLTFAYMAAVEQIMLVTKCTYIPLTWTTYDIKSPAGQLYKDVIKRINPVKFVLNDKKYVYQLHQDYEKYQKLYDRLAGPDWPSIEQIFTQQYTVSNTIEQELLEFRQAVEDINRSDREFYHDENFMDPHPLPCSHLQMVQTYLSEFEVSEQTKNWIKDIEHKLLAGDKFKFKPNKPKRL